MSTISIEALYEIYLRHPIVTTDTRQVEPGALFFALKGPSFNGNQFAVQAMEAGAAFAIVDEIEFVNKPNIFFTEDVLVTLQNLAKHHRQQLNIPVLAITGSNGKTTTKELVHAVLSTQYITYTTIGNLNNHIGIPLTLLKIKTDAQIAVVEMGANHQKEIEAYCTYTLPTLGLITNCGKAHLEGFGGIEGVRKGKGELFDYLRDNDGVAFACTDFDYFESMAKGLKKVYWYGTETGEVTGHLLQNEPFVRVEINNGFEYPVTLHTNLVGSYNIFNVLAACVIGRYFNVPFKQIQRAIESYEPSNNRSQLIEKDGNRIILDAYNANPTSMQVAIENFAALQAGNKMLFLGGMMELGEESIAEHEALIALINKYPWTQVVLVGGDFKDLKHDYLFFDTVEAASDWWKDQNDTGNYLLVKGSRSIKMERIIT
ncbi:UDP-N-acetylmuramoyl-tripeptide--D-alanyl-D-alanine ligase [soil metagenome]